MKKFLYSFSLFALIFFALTSPLAAGSESVEQKESLLFTGVVGSATDINSDGILDGDGEISVKIFTGGPAGFITLTFSEKEFSEMASEKTADGCVSTAVDSYAVGAVLSLEYYGYAEATEKDYFTASDVEKVKKGFIAAAVKNKSGTVFPRRNEVYDSYEISGEKESISVSYDEASGNAVLFYGGEEYTVAKKYTYGRKNTIVITERGNTFPLSELESKIKSLTEGEMLALFGDIDGDGLFDIMDIKSYSTFAPLSAEWNAPAGIYGAAFSYVLFDAEARISSPDGRTFSARCKVGAGLSVLIADEKGKYRFSAPALCKCEGKDEYARFGAVRNGKITAAEDAGEYILITFESGEEVLFPSAERLTRGISTEIFFEASGAVSSKTVNINKGESSWFYSLAQFYAKHGAGEFTGKTATAVFAADGTAVYADITE